MAKEAKAYIAMASTFILLAILIWVGPLDGWKFWSVLLASVPFRYGRVPLYFGGTKVQGQWATTHVTMKSATNVTRVIDCFLGWTPALRPIGTLLIALASAFLFVRFVLDAVLATGLIMPAWQPVLRCLATGRHWGP